MSTFGKKAISWWDYENHSKDNVTRWLHTPKDVQLKILEKWFPIGIKVNKWIEIWGRYEKSEYKIIGYSEQVWGYSLRVENNNQLVSTDPKSIIPTLVKPTDEFLYKIKREIKIKKIIDGTKS